MREHNTAGEIQDNSGQDHCGKKAHSDYGIVNLRRMVWSKQYRLECRESLSQQA